MISYRSISNPISDERRDLSQPTPKIVSSLFSAHRSKILTGYAVSSVLLSGVSLGFAFGFLSSSKQFHAPSIQSGNEDFQVSGYTKTHLLDRLPHEEEAVINILEAPNLGENLRGATEVEGHYALSLTTSPTNDLVYFNNPRAYAMLTKSSTVNSHYFLYESGLDAQINQAYCAVATSSVVLNSFRFWHDFNLPVDSVYSPYPYATQHDILNQCADQNVIHQGGILQPPYGLGLDQAVELLKCHVSQAQQQSNTEWTVMARHVDPQSWTVDMMREEIVNALKENESRVAINYDRATLGQIGGGHFSPIGAYDSTSDSFLILDVAKYKYPPVWAPAEKLFEAMATVDTCGTWKYPGAQTLLTSSILSNPRKHYMEALDILECKKKYRGYVLVSNKVLS